MFEAAPDLGGAFDSSDDVTATLEDTPYPGSPRTSSEDAPDVIHMHQGQEVPLEPESGDDDSQPEIASAGPQCEQFPAKQMLFDRVYCSLIPVTSLY
jgi:hypothetical protein